MNKEDEVKKIEGMLSKADPSKLRRADLHYMERVLKVAEKK